MVEHIRRVVQDAKDYIIPPEWGELYGKLNDEQILGRTGDDDGKKL